MSTPQELEGVSPEQKGAFVSAQFVTNHDLPYLAAAAKVIPDVMVKVVAWGGSEIKRIVVDDRTGNVETETETVPPNYAYVTVSVKSDSRYKLFLDLVEGFRNIDEIHQ